MSEDAWSAHEAACLAGERTYLDPQTGYQVFTRVGLLDRGECCGAGCRHCPYHHASIALEDRPHRISQPAWLGDCRPDAGEVCVLFWSGGKDSFLAYRALTKSRVDNLVLLTTFDRSSGLIAHQDLPIANIVRQAAALGLPLVGVPLHSQRDYVDHVVSALELVPSATALAFGDLHLTHIRAWREQAFRDHPATVSFKLRFPVWQVPYETLLDDLAEADVRCVISAVTAPDAGVAVGDVFDRTLFQRLPETIDGFGENGEFHTEVVI